MKNLLKKVFKHWEMFLVIFLILEFVVFGAANPKFLRPQSIMNSIVNYISVCIISLFVTMVMITGGIDIQAPAIIGLSSIIIGVLWSDAGLNIWAAVAIAMVVAALCGALSGFHATIGTGTTPKMIGKERDVLFVGYGAMLVEGFVAIMALIAACVLVPADYFAINAPADKFAALGMSVVDLPTLEKEVAESLMHRPGGSVSLAVGMAHIFGQIPWMSHLMSYWYHFAIMFEAVFILTAVDAGTRVGRFFLQEMIGKVIPKFGDKNWWPGIVVTSFLFTGAWGYLVYTGDISSIWPLFGISNQLLASVTLLIGTTMLLRMNKTKYAWITAAPGIFMTFITFWAGIWLIMYQYIPTQKYLLASLSVLVMVMMGFVIIGTLRRWSVLLKETKIVRDPYGDEVKEIVQE